MPVTEETSCKRIIQMEGPDENILIILVLRYHMTKESSCFAECGLIWAEKRLHRIERVNSICLAS